MSDFQIGNVVKLKSGGPKMTISYLIDSCSRCVWIDSSETIREFDFPNSIIELHVAPSKSVMVGNKQEDSCSWGNNDSNPNNSQEKSVATNCENGVKQSQLMSDHDILINWLNYPPEEAKEMLDRIKTQKEDAKLQIMAENPTGLFVAAPETKKG